MGINGLLTDVRWQWTGTEVTEDLLAGATVLPVLDPEAITAGEIVWIASTGPYEIVESEPDAATLTITPGLSIDLDRGAEVARDIGGEPGRAWVAEVILPDAERPVEVPLTIHDLAVMPEGTYDPPVVIVLSDDMSRVENLPGSMPQIDGVYIDPDTLPQPDPTYTWVKYADDASGAGMSDDPTGKAYLGLSFNQTSPDESTDPAEYSWSQVTGPEGGEGVPGPPGADGETTYTWIKYATSAAGVDLSDDPTGRDYLGIAYNKTTEVESTDPADYQWALFKGPQGVQGVPGSQGIPGPAGDDGQSLYTWLKYADTPTTGMSDSPVGKTYMGLAYNKTTSTESTNYADYSWSLIKGEQGEQGEQGPAGSQGIQGSPGADGADGTSLFTWLKYADTPTTGMSDDPTGKSYLGIAYNKTTATESSNYADYAWSLIEGPQGEPGADGNQGIPGPAGADGQPTYTWIKYGDSAAGAGLSDSPTGKTYIGFAFNKTTATESSTPGDYTWSLIQGPQGPQGPQGSQGIQGSPGADGADGASLYTWLKYADTPTTGMSDSPTGKTYMGIAYNKTSPTESSTYADYAWSLIQGPQGEQGNQGIAGPAGADGQPTYTWVKYADSAAGAGLSDSPTGKTYIGFAFNKTTATESSTPGDYTWSLIQGPQGPQGNQGVQGPAGADGQPTYTWIKYADSAAGAGLSDSPTGKTYIGIAPNKTTATESSTPGDYTWALIQGPQGPQGSQGIQGPAGADGQPTYTWIKYAPNGAPTSGQMSDSPAGMTHIGIASNKTTATESTTPGDYTWALFQGPQGSQGVQGPVGPNGQPTYTWVKYAPNGAPTAGQMSDLPDGMTHIGFAYNKLTQTESNVPTDYQWAQFQGPAGDPGPTAPPSSSPLLSTSGSASAITVVAHGTVDPNTILDYYMNGSFMESTRSTVMVFRADPSGNALVEETDYSFHVVARNSVGSAGPSGTVVGRLNPAIDDEQIISIVRSGFVLAGAIEVGNITIDPNNGITIPLAGGGEIRFPADGSPAVIEAILRTADLSVSGGLSINGITNYLNGKINLASGVGNPQALLNIDHTPRRLRRRFNAVTAASTGTGGLARTSNGATWAVILNLPTNGEKELVIFNDSDGSVITRIHSDSANLDMRSVMAMNNLIYVLGYRWNSTAGENQWRVQIYNTSGALQWSNWIMDQSGNRITSVEYWDGAIAADPANNAFWVARTQSNPRIRFFKYNAFNFGLPDAGNASPATSILTPEVAGVAPIFVRSLYVGNADFGSQKFVTGGWSTDASPGTKVYNADGTYDATNSWGQPGYYPTGLIWDTATGQFVSGDRDATSFYTMEYNTTKTDQTVYGQYTWYDNNASGGNKESAPSPIASRLIPKRAYPLYSIPAPPKSGTGDDDPNAVRVYTDTDTVTKLLTTITTGVATTYIAGTLVGTGAAPPAASTFTASSATGEVASADGATYLRGTGAFKFGGIQGTGDGRATVPDQSKISGFVPVGAIVPFAGVTIPAGWLKCDGSAFSSATYPELYSVLGSVAVTPNLTGRVPRGTTDGSVRVALGSDTVTMPEHEHYGGTYATGSAGNHSHPLGAGTTQAVPTGSGGGQRMTGAGRTGDDGAHSHGINGQSGAVVSNPAISNIPAALSVNYIIRAL